jgi:DNA-binding PadR family transcriptional regulator
MALEHALLVALRERPASGLELARRFDRSIGFFWHATHQQIYRVLARMEGDGWLTVRTVAQTGRPDKKEYDVSAAGRDVLAAWLAADTPMEPLRSELAVKLRAASYGDRAEVRRQAELHLAEHHTRLAAYHRMAAEQYPDPDTLAGADLDRYLVLRGGVRVEEFWIGWLTEYLETTQGQR